MQRFELPEFYLPWPARLNPHLDSARPQSKAWAGEMGILDSVRSPTWVEAKLDSMDLAPLGACTHPDAPAPELELTDCSYD